MIRNVMRWSEVSHEQSNNSNSAPTIKNHSVTHFNGYFFCYGGYDGRRNHMTLLVYSIAEQRWIRPHHQQQPPSAAAAAAPNQPADNVLPYHHPLEQDVNNNNNNSDPTIVVVGTPPPGRNGHSATLAPDPDDDHACKIIIIGGWLGTGPLAASDMHVLDISAGGRQLRWYQPAVKGTPPGPCNMHSADYVAAQREVFVFRGGNGREYLNDLHALQVDTLTWRKVLTRGQVPQPRANHSSAMLDETGELCLFGGWNGGERLNDIHILHVATSTWTRPRVGGVLPHPRAGMTLTALRGRLMLFGGSGTSAKCFNDLQILDRQEMVWLDVTQNEVTLDAKGGGSHNSQHHYHHHHDYDGDDPPSFRMFGGEYMVVNRQPMKYGAAGPQQQYEHDHNQHGGLYSLRADDQSDMTTSSSLLHPHHQPGGTGGTSSSSLHHHHPGYSAFRGADWRTLDMAGQIRRATTSVQSMHVSPNPNDEDSVPTVLIHGRGPGRRAGHTATAVNRKIYVFGGSCGSDYLNDFYALDTDPPPRAMVAEATSLQLIERRLYHFFNDEEFSDVTFLVQGQKVYGHKMVLSIVSDCFRAMFTTGFRESNAMEIEIPDCSHAAFLAVMEYIYTGSLPKSLGMMSDTTSTIINSSNSSNNNNNNNNNSSSSSSHGGGQVVLDDRQLGRIVEILELADRFFLDHLKQVCESMLQGAVNQETVVYLLQVGQKTNAVQLQEICQHFLRNRSEIGL